MASNIRVPELPPMCITKADVDYIVEVLDIAIGEL